MLKAAGADHLKRAKAITTANTYIRCAGGIFAKRLSPHFKDFALPVENSFRQIRPFPEQPHRYVSKIDPSSLLAAARGELETAEPDTYLVLLLALCCGMRRSEIDRLIWEQVDFAAGHIWIRT